ncbi:MAG: cytochrome c maturation protein CcmE [Bacteroidetes bacterium]|nr:cytochrome c maturation protein CcmE [Bacteroidota bacterium]
MKKTQIALLLFLVVVLAVIISMVYQADTYSSFDIARNNAGKEFHIIGVLNTDMPIEEIVTSNTLLLTFYMNDDKGYEAKVHHLGPKPTDFEKSDQIVLIGKFEEDVFVASSLLLKCPSKYKKEGMD